MSSAVPFRHATEEPDAGADALVGSLGREIGAAWGERPAELSRSTAIVKRLFETQPSNEVTLILSRWRGNAVVQRSRTPGMSLSIASDGENLHSFYRSGFLIVLPSAEAAHPWLDTLVYAVRRALRLPEEQTPVRLELALGCRRFAGAFSSGREHLLAFPLSGRFAPLGQGEDSCGIYVPPDARLDFVADDCFAVLLVRLTVPTVGDVFLATAERALELDVDHRRPLFGIAAQNADERWREAARSLLAALRVEGAGWLDESRRLRPEHLVRVRPGLKIETGDSADIVLAYGSKRRSFRVDVDQVPTIRALATAREWTSVHALRALHPVCDAGEMYSVARNLATLGLIEIT